MWVHVNIVCSQWRLQDAEPRNNNQNTAQIKDKLHARVKIKKRVFMVLLDTSIVAIHVWLADHSTARMLRLTVCNS